MPTWEREYILSFLGPFKFVGLKVCCIVNTLMKKSVLHSGHFVNCIRYDSFQDMN